MYIYVRVQEPETYYKIGPDSLVKVRLEQASGEPCLVVPYREFNMKLVRDLKPRAIAMSGFGGHFQSRRVEWFRGMAEVMHAAARGENITIVGAIATGSIGSAPGGGYAVGDIFAVVQAGASGGKGVVTTVNVGAVTGFVIVNPGTGYTVGDNKVTEKIPGAGDDAFPFDVDTLAATVYAVTNTGATADAHKRLMEFWPFTTPLPIASDGQAATWDMKLALATGT